MVDGKLLNFMNTTDVYALFGNLMDNAIESVIKEADEEKRIISVSIKIQNHGVHIHSENYCKDEICFFLMDCQKQQKRIKIIMVSE